VRAYVRCGDLELVLHGPLAPVLGAVAELLDHRARTTLARIALIDRERAPGCHAFDRGELLHLVASAHALLADPPAQVRRVRRVMTGPLPAADKIGELAVWLAARSGDVVYDLWAHSSVSS
jgi:hypothetical protein